jgi:hypothetical protein
MDKGSVEQKSMTDPFVCDKEILNDIMGFCSGTTVSFAFAELRLLPSTKSAARDRGIPRINPMQTDIQMTCFRTISIMTSLRSFTRPIRRHGRQARGSIVGGRQICGHQ